MIAFVCDSGSAWRAAGEILRRRVRTADGPFRVWHGVLGEDVPATAWRTNESADEQYAAARLAVRRGAKQLIHLGSARALAWTGDLVFTEIGGVVDLRELAHIHRMMPDLTTDLPISWPAKDLQPMFCKTDDSDDFSILATMAFPLTVPAFALEVGERTGAGLFDCSASGLCDAAREEELVARVAKMATGGVVSRSAKETGGAARELAVENAWRHVLRGYAERTVMQAGSGASGSG